MDVAGKTAIITGAGSGINLAFAVLLLSRGCNVLIADINLTADAQKLLSEPQHPSSGAKVAYKRTDVSSWSDLAALFPACRQEFGCVPDIVVPGAGIFEPEWSSFFWGEKEGEEGSRYKTLDVNLVHPIRLTRLAISEFIAAGKTAGVVLHVSSISGQRPKFSTPIYTAAKHGINGFVRSMAKLEGGFGIRVVAVAPGFIKTPLWTDHPEKLQMIDEEKDVWATPEEVADAMLRLVVDVDEWRGGDILEVGAGKDCTRRVEMFNDPGPPVGVAGMTASRRNLLDDQAIAVLKKEQEAARAAAAGKL